jgi:hypothetical protein
MNGKQIQTGLGWMLFGIVLSASAWSQALAQTPPQLPDQTSSQPPTQTPASAPAPRPAAGKKGKVPYTGPTNVIEQAPTPMLDAEGKQRLDPEGKPMFNPPVKQQRDKFGHPLFDEKGQPVFQTATELGFDEHGHKLHGKKEKPPKTIKLAITRGTLTVDGMIGKAALNYDINDFKYVYLYAPWIGTVVVSNVMFPGAKSEANAFDKNTLTVTVDEHTMQLYSDKMLLGKKPEPAFVLVDREFKLPSKTPVVGYGETLRRPYNWPGAKTNPDSKAALNAPPVPASLRPTQMLPPCPKGQMRASVLLPGASTEAPPCVPIVAGQPAAAPAKSAPAPEPAPAPAPPQ